MPFTDNLPAENTDPWYTPLVNAWGNLKAFVNGLELALAGKADTSHTHAAGDIVSGELSVARVPSLPTSKITGLDAALSSKVAGLNGATGLWIGTQTEYDAITTPSATVAYIIVAG